MALARQREIVNGRYLRAGVLGAWPSARCHEHRNDDGWCGELHWTVPFCGFSNSVHVLIELSLER